MRTEKFALESLKKNGGIRDRNQLRTAVEHGIEMVLYKNNKEGRDYKEDKI